VHALKKAGVPVMWITVHSDKGHDSFLIEPRLYTPHLSQVLNHQEPTNVSERKDSKTVKKSSKLEARSSKQIPSFKG